MTKKQKNIKKGEKLNLVLAKNLKEKGLKEILVPTDELIGKYTKEDIKDKKGEIILKSGFNLTSDLLEKILLSEKYNIELANVNSIIRGPYIFETIKLDKKTTKRCINDIYKVLRPGEAPS